MVLISNFLSALLLSATLVAAAPVVKSKPGTSPSPGKGPNPPSTPKSSNTPKPPNSPTSAAAPGSKPTAAAGPAPPTIPAGSVIIGYRTVAKGEADLWNKDHTISFSGNRIGTQIGEGIYLTPKRGQWAGSATDWTCVAYAASAKLDTIPKMWIPSAAGVVPNRKKLWFNKAATEQYIKDIGNPVDTIRLAYMSGSEPETQMAIPKGLLGKSGKLSITAYCTEKGKEGSMPSTVVDYGSFKNVKGAKNAA